MDDSLIKQFAEVTKQNSEQLAVVTNILKEMQAKDIYKTAGTSHDALRMHGQGGMFSTPGLDPKVLVASVRPYGLHALLPEIPSNDLYPFFGSITGSTASSGSQPTTKCGDAPTAYLKGCNLTAMYGTKRFDTNTIDVTELAKRINRGDFTDLMLQGALLNQNNFNFAPSGLDVAQMVNLLTYAEFVAVGRQFELALSTDMWTGTVANGTFPGLDNQIATGQVDATTNTACASLDSDVKDFGYSDVCGTAKDIVTYVTMLKRYLTHRAMGAGLFPVDWVWVMRPQLWDALSDCWPCRSMSSNCTNADNTKIAVMNDNVVYNERNRMRQGMILPVDGEDMPVVTDTGIYEYANGLGGSGANLKAGEYASAIYLVPLAIPGMKVTYMNYVNYNNAMAELTAIMGQFGNEIAVTDNGKFAWARSKINFCFKYAGVTEQRVVLRTPWLAGKLQHVKYTPLQHLVSEDPSSVYNKDGGVSVRGTSSTYHVWS
jgi:hypothetical protein